MRRSRLVSFAHRFLDQSWSYSGPRSGLEYVTFIRDGTRGQSNASCLVAYFPPNAAITLKTERLAGTTLRGPWFSPRDGSVQSLCEFPKQSRVKFSPHTKSNTEDWILVLDDAARNYLASGIAIEQPRDRR